ncbi:MAG: S26 family signal peptidase [Rhodospirillales bacterium]|nr:MAG: S26 family signal peptidase [Rhodospirillales bacterium]
MRSSVTVGSTRPRSGRRPVRPVLALTGVIGLAALLAFAVGHADSKLVIINSSPSMAPGLYRRAGSPPAPGAIIAFTVPPVAIAHARQHGMSVGLSQFLKPVAAGAGDRVCVSRAEGLRINGVRVAPVAARDHDGHDLPIWNHCRVLEADEYFLYAPRVANSFDSRYYGPVPQDAIKGVYVPLWTW